MKKDLSQIYSEMYNTPDDGMFSQELLEKVTISDKFALNDYSKLIYEQSNDIFDYLDELINEASGHGDDRIVKDSLKDAYNKGLVNIEPTKKGWIVKSKRSKDMLSIHKGEKNFHYLRRFLDKIEALTS